MKIERSSIVDIHPIVDSGGRASKDVMWSMSYNFEDAAIVQCLQTLLLVWQPLLLFLVVDLEIGFYVTRLPEPRDVTRAFDFKDRGDFQYERWISSSIAMPCR